jgi:chromosome segregation ATPase
MSDPTTTPGPEPISDARLAIARKHGIYLGQFQDKTVVRQTIASIIARLDATEAKNKQYQTAWESHRKGLQDAAEEIESLEAQVTSLRLQVEEGERERERLRRHLIAAAQVIETFRRECDPGEDKVIVSTIEMLGASAALAPIEEDK